jgi:PRC-barrel domain
MPGGGTREIAMTTSHDGPDYVHRAAVDAEGDRIGKISKIYLDDQTGQPLWVLVETGLFGTRQSLAPVHGSRLDGELVVLAVSKDQVKNAPNIERDAHISESEQDALHQYYRGHLGAGQTNGDEESGRAGTGTREQPAADRDADK